MAQGKRTPPATEEAVYAEYQKSWNYSEVSRTLKVPLQTVWDIVDRLGKDVLVEVRTAQRAALIPRIWSTVTDGLTHVDWPAMEAHQVTRAMADLGLLATKMEAHAEDKGAGAVKVVAIEREDGESSGESVDPAKQRNSEGEHEGA